MDTVRFGRVLGQGARQAAKTLVSAVDAATAPNPAPRPSPPSSATPPPFARPSAASPAPNPTTAARPQPAPPTILPPAPTHQPASSSSRPPSIKQAAPTTRGLAEGSRRFGRAIWAPAVRLSGVLWLELTGVFFALFALVAGIAAWRLRSALPPLSPGTAASLAPASDDRTRLLFAAGMVLVFGYFSFSSFLKANRRSRRH